MAFIVAIIFIGFPDLSGGINKNLNQVSDGFNGDINPHGPQGLNGDDDDDDGPKYCSVIGEPCPTPSPIAHAI